MCLEANMNCNDEDYLAIKCYTMAGKNCLDTVSPQIIALLQEYMQRDIANPPEDIPAVRERQETEQFADFARVSRGAD